MRVLGRTFPQFLNGLDNLHEYLRFSFPKLKPPSFYCEHESRTGLTLHYRSVAALRVRRRDVTIGANMSGCYGTRRCPGTGAIA